MFGIVAGTFTGLIPGIHVNLISILVLSATGNITGISPLIIITFIISMALTHTFVDSIPSIFLGAPDGDQILSVLPGHKMLLAGQGYNAVKLTVIGSLFGLLLATLLIPFLITTFPNIYEFIKKYIALLIVIIVIIMILTESKKLKALFQFLLAGTLGLIVLSAANLKHPLLGMLSGLFGISTLIVSLQNKVVIPKQKTQSELGVTKSVVARATGISVFSGGTVALLPGLGSAQAGILGSYLAGDLGDKGFLILIGGINTVNMIVSLLTFYTIDKTRNGAVVVVKEIIKQINLNQLFLLLAVGLIVGGLATLLTLHLAKTAASYITKINYRKICFFIITFVSLVVFLFSGFFGLMIMIISAAIGILPSYTGVKKSHNLGCLLLPVILWMVL